MKSPINQDVVIDDARIRDALTASRSADAVRVREVLAQASELKGLTADETAVLTGISDPQLLGELFETARKAKEEIYGR